MDNIHLVFEIIALLVLYLVNIQMLTILYKKVKKIENKLNAHATDKATQ